ncbi:DUF2955 domain-containing protein [Photobacterium leiognathi]|uniref:DUF2955 domain-containing protein n=1 Tax=Photobacterium leiognathi TaxID=553611 RepID=UPI0029818664|nr:DUF2955 domain-containing protein [Photobacterium leiognathi]
MKTMRIWFGCVLGLAISMIFGWSYGFFTALLPIMVLMNTDRWTPSIIIQLIVGIVWTTLQVTVISGFLQPYSLLMTVAVGLMLLGKCIAMTNPKTYLFGFSGLLIGSIMFNFGSYTGFDIEDFSITLWMCGLVTAPITALAYFLFPEPISEQPSPPAASNTQRVDRIGMLRQTALGWIVAMIAFLLFQFGDLQDSLSAQASIFIVLAPMTLIGSMAVAKIRITGTFLGCLAGMIIQLGLYTWINNGLLFLMAYAIAAGFFCRWIAQGSIKSSIAFSAMSALTVPLTTALVPEKKDAFFSILYRFSSIFVAVVLTSLVIWITHHFLVRVIKAPNEQF